MALETQTAAKRSRKEKLFFPLPALPPLEPVFERLPLITSSLPVIKLISVVLER